ncbi:MAG: IclR family transcriptional regulator [Thermaerobacter sp.]|nr:IclR family transcriptional regulator [Thermaerobacter sp.]
MLRGVSRLFEILDALASPGAEGVGLHELGRRVSLADPTLLRFLGSLQELGFVRADERGKYRLTEQFKRYTGGAAQDVRLAAKDILQRLTADLQEDVQIATLDADSAVCIETLKSSHLLQVAFNTGFRAPIHASAMGKVLLAHMPDGARRDLIARSELRPYTKRTITDRKALERDLTETRRRGFAVDDQELELGINCIAAPIFQDSLVVASLSLTAPSHRKPIADLLACAPRVVASAQEISDRLRSGLMPDPTA